MDLTRVDFSWVQDLHKKQCFTFSRGTDCPTKSTDLGSEGHTASLTDWHELLQLTAPDPTCGVVFVRGRFPGIPESMLARAQVRDDGDDCDSHAGGVGGISSSSSSGSSKGTFGTRLAPPRERDDLHVGERIVHGWANFKWPYAQYDLKRRDEPWDASSGTLEELSFFRDGTYFHVMRIRWGRGSTIKSFPVSDGGGGNAPPDIATIKIRSGGVLHFGCTCSNGLEPGQDAFNVTVPQNSDGQFTRLNCTSSTYRKRLEMQVFVNGVAQPLPEAPSIRDATEINLSSVHEVNLVRHEPTVIVSTYALRRFDNEGDTVGPGHFEHLEHHLGISNESPFMTDRLWTALCSTNYDATEAVELSCVGRAVEQTMSIASVPFSAAHDDEVGAEIVERAIVHNIITPQYVDVQSAYYQLRLLIKVYSFIESRYLAPDLLNRYCPIDNIRKTFLEKLKSFICAAVAWLVNTDMSSSKLLMAVPSWSGSDDADLSQEGGRLHDCSMHRERLNIERSYNQACYAILGVWYAVKKCPTAVPVTVMERSILPRLNNAFDLVQHRADRNKDPTAKNDILQWLHLSCLYLLCSQTFCHNDNGDAVDGFEASVLDRDEVQRMHQRFEKYVSRLKTRQSEAYTVLNEELDRLHLLAEELGLAEIQIGNTSSLVRSRARMARRSIRHRRRTTTFMAGPKVRKGPRPVSTGPWELVATNHASYLRVVDEFSLSAARDRLFHFMMADYGFMASWDRADSKLVGKWWGFETNAIICSTLVDLKMEGKLRSARSLTDSGDAAESVFDVMVSPPIERGNPLDPLDKQPQNESEEKNLRSVLVDLQHTQDEFGREQLLQLQQLVEQAERGSNPAVRPYDWVAEQPPFPFHARRWIQSLTDTPSMYRATQTRNVPLRKDIARYLFHKKRTDIISNPEYSLANITNKLPPDVLQHFAVFDIRITSRFTFETKETSVRTSFPREEIVGQNPMRSYTNQLERAPPQIQYTPSQLDTYRDTLLRRMNDSLVDLGAKYRIMFSKQCSPELLGATIYLWHPDALDTVDDFFGTESRFVDSRERHKWVTSINIAHWTLRPGALSERDLARFDENRSYGDFPPPSIARLGLDDTTERKRRRRKLKKTEPLAMVDERSSSLVVSGDRQGYIWQCSIWSSVTDAAGVATPVEAAEKVLHHFINRQGSARCLVFLVLLGHLCEQVSFHYDEVLGKLDDILGLGDKVLLEGLEWGTTEAVNKLKKMLWGLEALRVFDDRLSASLSEIEKAQTTMEGQVRQNAPQLHVDLLQVLNFVSEGFAKRYAMMVDVQTRIHLKIKQVTGLRDGISTVANVEDSQTTIRQGDNIRILTYITIAYLPLSFVAGLFSISHATFMNTANNLAFALLTALFTVGTYAVALTFESITDQLHRIRRVKVKSWLWRRRRLGRHSGKSGVGDRVAGDGGSDDIRDNDRAGSSARAENGSKDGGDGVSRAGTGTSSWLRRGLVRTEEQPNKIGKTV